MAKKTQPKHDEQPAREASTEPVAVVDEIVIVDAEGWKRVCAAADLPYFEKRGFKRAK